MRIQILARVAAVAPLALLVAALVPRSAQAQALSTELVVSGLSSPLYLCAPPGDLERLFVVERGGKIKILRGGAVSGVFLDVGPGGLNKIVSGGEQGLLGLAFHPSYAANGFFYINYTDLLGRTVVERYQVSANPDVADTSTATTILGPIVQPQGNHNGGCLQFGPDGKLYIGMGDGGGANDQGTGHAPGGNAQSGSTLLGKMLRLDVDLPPPHVPPDNPFVGDPNVLNEVWALGLRNPWRFSFDRATGDMYIGDVGQSAREEIDFEPAGMGGRNYGWRCMEGFNCTGLSGCTCNAPSLTLPIHDYTHGGGNCSVTGGYVYRGCAIPSLQGTYFFADFCSHRIWSFEYDGTNLTNFTDRTGELGAGIGSPTSFGEDGYGELYICDFGGGEIYKIVTAAPEPDCNLNGVADACDIALGTSQDQNQNGVPDECECNPPPFTYCTGKRNSLLCLPTMGFQGVPRASGAIPFFITADQILNQKNGFLFYGYMANSVPFQGGTLCVRSPLQRTPVQNSGGSASGDDCTGTFSFEFNARIQSGVDPMLVPGQQVNAQYWSRDPGAGIPTSLTNAVEFVICN